MMESQATLITDDDDQPDTMRATITSGSPPPTRATIR